MGQWCITVMTRGHLHLDFTVLKKDFHEMITVMCLNVGTPKIFNFPFVPNGKLIIFRSPKIQAYYSLIMMCLNIGAPKIH